MLSSHVTALQTFVVRHKDRIKPIIRRRAILDVLSFLSGGNLAMLARLHGTDKLAHGYIPHYRLLLSGLRKRRFNLLEIGIGGYAGHTVGGESLRMWKAYFPHARIHGLDILQKPGVAQKRITVWQGSQVDPEILHRIHHSAGGFDVIIDDGSHRNEHVIGTFQFLFPLLNSGGFYFVEDVQTSYWPEYGGKAMAHDSSDQTSMGFFKNLADRLNHEEFQFDDAGSAFDEDLDSVFFWHNLIAIRKASRSQRR
jgi:hypothetical protein